LKGKPVRQPIFVPCHYYHSNFFFHFKLHFCSLAQGFDSLSDFAEHLATNVDIVFPVIHGKFGEDGGIQVCSYQWNLVYKEKISIHACWFWVSLGIALAIVFEWLLVDRSLHTHLLLT